MGAVSDAIKIMGPKSLRIIARVKTELIAIFEIIDIRSISFYLGFKVKQDWENRIIKFF